MSLGRCWTRQGMAPRPCSECRRHGGSVLLAEKRWMALGERAAKGVGSVASALTTRSPFTSLVAAESGCRRHKPHSVALIAACVRSRVPSLAAPCSATAYLASGSGPVLILTYSLGLRLVPIEWHVRYSGDGGPFDLIV